jgi:hypothetical protein
LQKYLNVDEDVSDNFMESPPESLPDNSILTLKVYDGQDFRNERIQF